MKTVAITWMNGQQRKFDVVRYTISDRVIRLFPFGPADGMVVIPIDNVMILEEEV